MKKNLKLLKQWPVVIMLIWLLMTVISFFADKIAGVVVGVFLIAYVAVLLWLYFRNKTLGFTNWEQMAERLGFLHNALLSELDVPYAVMLDDGKIAGMGTHKELLEDCEVYREIYDSQYQKPDAKEDEHEKQLRHCCGWRIVGGRVLCPADGGAGVFGAGH